MAASPAPRRSGSTAGGPVNQPNYDDGGFAVLLNNLPYLSGAGAQLFSLNGTTATLFGGTYQYPTDGSTLIAVVVSNAVPEPVGWVTMILGLGIVGAGLRQRRRARVRFA